MRMLCTSLLAIGLATAASAVLTDAPDPSQGAAPLPPVAGFANVGLRGGLTAVYLGNGAVLTANHVGPGNVTFQSGVSAWVPGSEVQIADPDGTLADLLVFAVQPAPALPPLEIVAVSPAFQETLFVVGNGRDRGASIVWDPNGSLPPGPTGGYSWGATRTLRWGTNQVELRPFGRIYGTQAFGSRFDALGTMEAQAVTGDSGGAAFVAGPDGLQLAGVIFSVEEYLDQPASTSFYGQATYYADLAVYREAILDAIPLPEPGGALGPGGVLLAGLARARAGRRRARAQLR